MDAPPPVSLDLKGLKCPLPALRTRKAMGKLGAGEEIVVVCTDPLSMIDIPHFVRENGHALIAQERDETTFTFHIRKGG